MNSDLQSIGVFIERSIRLPKNISFERNINESIIFENPYEVDGDDTFYIVYLTALDINERKRYGVNFTKYKPATYVVHMIQEAVNDFSQKLGQ